MTIEELKIQISDIVKTLKREKKQHLAECIEKNWNKTAAAYSKELNSWEPSRPMEKELHSSFEKELERLGIIDSLKIKILHSLQKKRVLQTAPHLVATESPRMFCINWLGSLGVKIPDFYVIAMFSGIPFSNNSHPGRINRKDGSINLFPSNIQDGLVFRSTIQNKLIESRKKIPAQINKLLPQAVAGESYTKWALLVCQKIESEILKKENLVFIDINEVVSNYLIRVLRNTNHIFHKIFFDLKTRCEFMETFRDESIFNCAVMNGKYEKMENMIFSVNSLKSKHKEILLADPKILISELENTRICPGLILSFMAIAFLNEFKCFGSFAQVEYLPLYQEKLAKLKFMKEFDIKKIPTANLTTGIFPDAVNFYPVDIIIDTGNDKLKQKEKILLGELWLPMKDKLINGRQNKK